MKKYFAALLIGALTLTSCELLTYESKPDADCLIRGYAQKGQLNKGSQVTVFELDGDMVATGKSYPANIDNALGSFMFSVPVEAPYLEVRAEGYYFNEVTGENSEAPIYLEAVVPTIAGDVNVNLFTTLTKPRIKRLLVKGLSYSEAVGNAQEELLAALGVSAESDDFTDIDITGADKSDALLLAYACIIQQDRTTGELVTLIQNAATEFEPDGKLSAETVDAINANRANVNPFEVIRNIADFYTANKIIGRTVPPFHKYLDEYYNAPFVIGSQPMVEISRPLGQNYHATGATFDVLADEDFDVRCEASYVTLSKSHVIGCMYTVEIAIPENTDTEERVTTLLFVDKSGRELARREFRQDANLQVVELEIGGGSGSRAFATVGAISATFEQGDVIGVNGTTHELAVESSTRAIVRLLPAESYFFSYPVGCVTPADHVARVNVTIPDNVDASTVIPYCAALGRFDGLAMPNPAKISLVPAVALLGISLEGYDGVKSIVFSGCAGEAIAGEFTYVPDQRNADLTPGLNTEIVCGTGKQIRLNYQAADGTFYAPMPPVEFTQGFSMAIYDVDNQLIDTVAMTNRAFEFKAGTMYRLRLQRHSDQTSISMMIGSLPSADENLEF